MKNQYVSPEQFAQLLTIVHPASVRRWLRAGMIQGKKIGRKWLIPTAELTRITNEGIPLFTGQ